MRPTHNMKQLVSGELDLAPTDRFFIGSVKTNPRSTIYSITIKHYAQIIKLALIKTYST